jgi:putative hydrolase of the HAD superfamily
MAVRVVRLDGDDTLWRSETRFNLTQGNFHDLLRRHVPDADVEGKLAETEMKNLAIYGYSVAVVVAVAVVALLLRSLPA